MVHKFSIFFFHFTNYFKGLSDPYCKIWLEDERGAKDKESKRKTAVIKKTLNPEWNESFSLSVILCIDTIFVY